MALVLDGSAGISGVDGTASNPAIEGTDSNTGIFYPAADTVAIGTGGTEALRVNSSQNVGIGTTTPPTGYRLDVSGGRVAFRGATEGTLILDDSAIADASTPIQYLSSDGGAFIFGNANRTVTGGTTNSTERMRITSAGEVLVGTTNNTINGVAGGLIVLATNRPIIGATSASGTPTTLVALNGGNQAADRGVAIDMYSPGTGLGVSGAHATARLISASSNAATQGGYLRFDTENTSGSLAERMRIDSSGNLVINISTGGYFGLGNTITDYPSLTFPAVYGTASTGTGIFAEAGNLVLQPRSSGALRSIIFATGNPASERMRIDSSGNVGIGTTSPATLLHVNGTIRYTNRPAAGTITAIGYDANGDLKNSSSSLRYKYDIEDYSKGLDTVMQLRPVSFKFNGEERTNIGFIAEEVDALGLPEVMLYNEEEQPDGVLYANMVSLLTKAIQEQQAMIEETKAEIAALKGNA